MMKLYQFLVFGLLCFGFTSCTSDDLDVYELSYDGNNENAPILEAGVHEAGARFTSRQLDGLVGKQLESVEFYLAEFPDRCEVLIYNEGSSNSPGTLIYSADITFLTENFDWNFHTLSNPIDITGEDLWIVIKVEHSEAFPSIGCDPGPAQSNGDWMLSYSDNQWRSFRDRTGNQVSINWNIRGIVR